MEAIKRALVSVSDKSNLLELANTLVENNIEIISTGGTRDFLNQNNISTINIEDVTGNPESFSGRMKTISFNIMSSILFKRSSKEDQEEIKKFNLKGIDLVVCNLYPFAEAKKNNAKEEELIEKIDVGGPTMLRSAAKNFYDVVVLSDTSDYSLFINRLKENKTIDLDTRRKFAVSTFKRLSQYDEMIFHTLGQKELTLRYGENPHQEAKLILGDKNLGETLASSEKLHGKEMSYNNYLDSDCAYKCTGELFSLFPSKDVVTIVKHANPCGIAVSDNQLEALEEAWKGDPVSAFGSILCFSKMMTKESAYWLSDKFVEIVIAPDYSIEALSILQKKKNIRILKLKNYEQKFEETLKSINGGYLKSSEDLEKNHEFQSVTDIKFPSDKEKLATFGIIASKYLKSNSIAIVDELKNGSFSLIGAGMGQPNRVDSLVKLAIPRALDKNDNLNNVVMVSDAFFPFSDCVEIASKHGIKMIIQPGGSIRDNEVIKTCNEKKIAMALTGKRHFRH